ncbi:hypothetical protein HanRHA438_Chr14g0679651 [Helianthus annuus]|nr:hypothetical protein HanRHA438_Chr14g0679651 [Helianthus annuus]
MIRRLLFFFFFTFHLMLEYNRNLTFDCKDVLLKNYKDADDNIKKLKDLGARVLNEVDARNMSTNRHFRGHTYDLIIYNFPHSGFRYNDPNDKAICDHTTLVHEFFKSAFTTLKEDRQVQVTHKNYSY